MEFVAGDVVRMGFGFFNPNHAAALICAVIPFCWGWNRGRWVGISSSVVLCAMLAATFSRTGFIVLALEAGAWWMMCDGCRRARSARTTIWGVILSACLACIAAWWMWPRLALDGAILNRPKIWLAGLRLFAANPMGVRFGNSGEIASAFMLPDGITVRTLVNSHLTLLVEMGVFVGGAWLAFIALALCVGRKLRRTWVAFAGLAVSAFSASVFDWHVLFDFKEMGGCGTVNFVLAWGLFAAFVVMGAAMVSCGVGVLITQRRVTAAQAGLAICSEPSRAERVPRDAECAEGFWRMASAKAVLAVAGVAVALCAAGVGLWSDATPKVEGEYVVCGRRWNAVPTVPSVYRDEGWSLKSVAKRFPDGARFCIRPGVPEGVVDSGEVWLFGDAVEAAWRFKDARLKLVDPPEFFDPPTNAVVIKTVTRI